MPDTAKVNFNEIDLTPSVGSGLKGVNAVQGITKRGPYLRTDILIKSWEEFVRIFGGELAGNDFPTLCKRALDGGSQLRVNRVGHYTTIGNASTLTSLKAAVAVPFQNAQGTPQTLFEISPKYAGLDYNNIIITIKNASNGDINSFDLIIDHLEESNLTESYKNLKVVSGVITDSEFLKGISLNSELVDITYLDTSAITDIRPINQVHSFTGGTDGGVIVDTDYIGDSASGTGFHAFDDIDDCITISVPNLSTAAIHIAGVAYVESRKDMIYLIHLASLTANGLVAEKAALNIDSNYVGFYAGGLKVTDNITGAEKSISELGDIIGLSASVDADTQYGPWYSFAGDTRGRIFNALGVVTNFGTPGRYNDLNLLANRQINCVVVQDGKIKLSGNFTGQLKQSRLSYISNRKLLITIKKDLKPILNSFLEEPTDIILFKAIYRTVKPYFDSLKSDEKRAISAYRWEGDQRVSTLNDVVINKKSDLDQGKYRVKLFITDIVSLQEFTVDITLSPLAGVEFED